MAMRTLVLTPWRTPHEIIHWQEAVIKMFLGKVRVIEEYDEIIGCVGLDQLEEFEELVDALPAQHDQDGGDYLLIKVPAVVTLVRNISHIKRGAKFSRINVLTRDKFRCQYCGQRLPASKLNYDHVIPRDQGGKTEWTNIVTSCYDCNSKKANRTPQQAGMKLLSKPVKPKYLPLAPIQIEESEAPSTWKDYCVS